MKYIQRFNESISKKEQKLIIIAAPSGAGKTTIVRHLLKQSLNLAFSISATSRAQREGEQNGKDYWFLSIDEFKKPATLAPGLV